MVERKIPSQHDVEGYLKNRTNWGRWGKDDEVGAVNLITPEKRAAAASLVRSGRAVSLTRPFPTESAANNPNPAQHWMRFLDRSLGGAAIDYYGIAYHGQVTTHLDALCHVWDQNGMWNGRDPSKENNTWGANFGSVDKWEQGIITRGVLLDIPKYRGGPYVTQERPVHGWEMEDVAQAQGVSLQPGDALVVYQGREKWQEANLDKPYGSRPERPGMHASCLPFIRDKDVAALVWDMMDFSPYGYDIPWTVHGAIFAYGVAILDNALLQPLAEACAEEGRYEFMLLIAPLSVAGGTGSPVNPIALF